MFCSNCGKEIPEGTVFCSFCGANQGAAPAQTSAPQPQPPKKNNTLILAIVAIVAVVAIVLGVFVIAPALSKKDETPQNSTPTSVSTAENTTDNTDNNTESPTTNKKLTKLEYGLQTGKMFESDMGEYGKIQISFGYDKDTGLVKQLTANIAITPSHSEYESMKSDFISIDSKLKSMNDKNASATYNEFSDYINCFYSFQNLIDADRAERVKIASEELDIPYNESDIAFYIDDITDTLVNKYGFTVMD